MRYYKTIYQNKILIMITLPFIKLYVKIEISKTCMLDTQLIFADRKATTRLIATMLA